MNIHELIEWLKEDESNRVECETVEERYTVTRALVDAGYECGDYARDVLREEAGITYMHPFLYCGQTIEYYSISSDPNHCIQFCDIELENMEMPDLEEFV